MQSKKTYTAFSNSGPASILALKARVAREKKKLEERERQEKIKRAN